MNAPRRGLGRGLGALIPSAPAGDPPRWLIDGDIDRLSDDSLVDKLPPRSTGESTAEPTAVGGVPRGTSASVATLVADSAGGLRSVGAFPGAYYADLPVGQISPNPRQPRQDFEAGAMAELVASIREVGLLQPVVVRRSGEAAYELVMGERRWRAGQQAGLAVIPAIVRDTTDDALLRDALLENLHRAQLNPLEEAAAYQQLLDDFSCTHEELASRIGRSRPQISNTIRLLQLTPAVQRRVAAGVLSAGHARALVGVAEPLVQDRLAQRVVAEGISVRGLEEIVAAGQPQPGARRGRGRPSPVAPGLSEIAERLSERLETRVKVALGRSRGKITVEFATLEDLHRIVQAIDPRDCR